MRPHLGIAGMSHMLVPLPLTEILDALSASHLALRKIPPLRSEMCMATHISNVALFPVKASRSQQRGATHRLS